MSLFDNSRSRSDGKLGSQEQEMNTKTKPTPTVVMPIGVVTLRGILRDDNGSTTFVGEWGMSFGDLQSDDDARAMAMTNPFFYKLQSINTSQESPYSGKYIGHFLYDKDKVEILDTMEIYFEENEEGSYNAIGKGVSKFGCVDISGILKDGILTINKRTPPPTLSRHKRQRTGNVRLKDYDLGLDTVEEDETETAGTDTKDDAYKPEANDDAVAFEDEKLDEDAFDADKAAESEEEEFDEEEELLLNDANPKKRKLSKSRPQTSWMDRFNELVEYKNKYGNTRVPRNQRQLGAWVHNQRQAHRNNKLTAARKQLLDEIGFDWGTSRESPKSWMERLKELKEYEEKHGNTLVPQKSGQLGEWVHTQRKARRRGELSAERIALLDEIGFVWNVRTEQFKINYKKLVAFKNKHGHTNVSKEHDRKLYQWCRYQRDKAAIINDEGESLLDSDERALLEDIGFVFYRRECSKKVSRIEFEFFHILTMAMEDLGLEFFSLDKAYMSLRFRPDGVINVEVALGNIVVFVEVDERGHNTSQQSYKLPKDETRMVTLRDEAMTDGSVKGVVFIRVNTGELRDVYLPQIETVKEVLEGILSDDDEPKGCHVHYIDYKEDDDHVQEARKKGYEFNVKTYHTKNFNPNVTRISTNANNAKE